MVQTRKQKRLANKRTLPTEIILQIFSHLPAEEIQRLHSIMDAFPSTTIPLLQDPSFIHNHAFNMMNNPSMKQHIIQHDKIKGIFSHTYLFSLNINAQSLHTPLFDIGVSSSTSFDFQNTIMIGSCYGLVCLAVMCMYRPKKIKVNSCTCCAVRAATKSFKHLVLWNPVTGEYYTLPDPNKSLSSTEAIYGFGYDSINESFKVVMALANGSMTWIYDLSTNAWETIESIDWHAFEVRLGHSLARIGHHLNANLRWIVSNVNIISLNLVTKVCSYINLPDCCSDPDQSSELGVLEDCLVVSCNLRNSKEFGIWVMKDYGIKESWTKVYTIRTDESLMKMIWKPCGEYGVVLLNVDGRLAMWNPKLEKFRFISSTGTKQGMIYVSTFVSPKPKV